MLLYPQNDDDMWMLIGGFILGVLCGLMIVLTGIF